MDKQQRLEIRNEIKLYLEEERREEAERKMMQEEKEFNMLPLISSCSTFFLALIFSFSTNVTTRHLLYFSVFFCLASLLSYFVVKVKLSLNIKRLLFIIPCLIYILGLIMPIILLEIIGS